MKIQLKFRFIFIALLSVILLSLSFQNLYAQDAKKNKLRLKADYFKIMDGESYLDIKATAKVDKKNIEVSNIDVIIYNEFDDESIEIGTIKTNMDGKSRFIIQHLNTLKPDTTNAYKAAKENIHGFVAEKRGNYKYDNGHCNIGNSCIAFLLTEDMGGSQFIKILERQRLAGCFIIMKSNRAQKS